MQRNFKITIIFVFAALSVLVLQNAFELSDHRKTEHAVRSYTLPGGTQSLGEFLQKRSPDGQWMTEITHGCRGIVRATYDAKDAHYEFDYDVPQHVIHPANELGKEALADFAGAAGDPSKWDRGSDAKPQVR
jgi:hypothetical protein